MCITVVHLGANSMLGVIQQRRRNDNRLCFERACVCLLVHGRSSGRFGTLSAQRLLQQRAVQCVLLFGVDPCYRCLAGGRSLVNIV